MKHNKRKICAGVFALCLSMSVILGGCGAASTNNTSSSETTQSETAAAGAAENTEAESADAAKHRYKPTYQNPVHLKCERFAECLSLCL